MRQRFAIVALSVLLLAVSIGCAATIALRNHDRARADACEGSFARAGDALAKGAPEIALQAFEDSFDVMECAPTANVLMQFAQARMQVIDSGGKHVQAAIDTLVTARNFAPENLDIEFAIIELRLAAGGDANVANDLMTLSERPEAPIAAHNLNARMALALGDLDAARASIERLAQAGAQPWHVAHLELFLDAALGRSPAELIEKVHDFNESTTGAIHALFDIHLSGLDPNHSLPSLASFDGAEESLRAEAVALASAPGKPEDSSALSARLAAALPDGDARRSRALVRAFHAGAHAAVTEALSSRPLYLSREPRLALIAAVLDADAEIERGADTAATRAMERLIGGVRNSDEILPGAFLDTVAAARAIIPGSAELALLEADAWAAVGEPAIALAAARDAVAAAPNWPVALARLVRAYQATGRDVQAAAVAQQYLGSAMPPDNACDSLGVCFVDVQGAVAEALRLSVSGASSSDETQSDVRILSSALMPAYSVQSALVLVQSESASDAELSAAVRALLPILERAPRHPGALIARGLASGALGDGRSMQLDLEQAVEVAPARAEDVLRMLMRYAGQTGSRPAPRDIVRAFETVAETAIMARVESSSVTAAVLNALYVFADLSNEQADPELSVAIHRAILKKQPGQAAALNNLAFQLAKLDGKERHAQRLAEFALRLAPDVAEYQKTFRMIETLVSE